MKAKSMIVSGGDEESSVQPTTNNSNQDNWNPPWLGKPVLFGFVVLYLLLALGLILINHFVKRSNGFALTFTTNHYVWTYGPTVILVVVVGLWRRVQYCAMVNQPWQQLYNAQPQPAEKTILLDYLSPLQITSFKTAIKYRHFPVAASISTFALLKLVIVISTTLFIPEDKIFSQDIGVSQQTKFGTSRAGFINNHGVLYSYDRAFDPKSVLSEPVWSYWDMRSQYHGTNPPVELSETFTNFSAVWDIPPDSISITANIEIFVPRFACEVVQVPSSWRGSSEEGRDPLRLRTSSCHSPAVYTSDCDATISHDCLSLDLMRLNCTGYDRDQDPSASDSPNYIALNSTTVDTYQYGVVMTRHHLDDVDVNRDEDTQDSIVTVDTTALLCKLTHSLYPGNATTPALGHGPAESVTPTGKRKERIPGLSDLQLSEIITAGLWMAGEQGMFSGDTYGGRYDDNPILGYPAFLGLLVNSTSNGSVDSLMDPETLQSASEEVLNGLAHQVVRRFFVEPAGEDTAYLGSITYHEGRLYARPAALWTMASLFITMSFLVTPIMVHARRGLAPQSPATLASSASALARSTAMDWILVGSGSLRSSQLRDKLKQHRFLAKKNGLGGPRIEIATLEDELDSMQPEKRQSAASGSRAKRPWMLYSSRGHTMALTLFIPLVLILTLELLWQLTENDASTPFSDSSVAAYAIRYSSTAMALLVATLYNSLDFSIAIMTVFSQLNGGPRSTEQSLSFTILEDLSPVALYKSVRYKHYGAGISLAAATIGSTLTIIVSGLWFVDTSVIFSEVATANMQAGWAINFTATTSLGTTQAKSDMNLQLHGVSSSTPMIWKNYLVLPNIDALQTSKSMALDTSTSQIYNFNVPAVEPFLECTSLPEYNITKSIEDHDGYPYWDFNITAALPPGCKSSQGTSIATFQLWEAHGDFPHGVTGFIGKASDLDVSSTFASSKGCPSIGLVFGYAPDDLKALICTQRLRSTQINMTYSSGHLSAQVPTHSEQMNIGSNDGTETFMHSLSGLSSLRYDFKNTFRESIQDSTGCCGMYDDHTFMMKFCCKPSLTSIDTVFDYAINNPHAPPISMDEISDPDHMVRAIDDFYRNYMTLVIDIDSRPGIGTPGILINGTVEVRVPQLRMSGPSKITLQVLLGIMVILGSLAHWMVNMRTVIPRNPMPIASRMALFSGSRLLENLRAETTSEDGYSDDTVRIGKEQTGVAFQGRLFRLGWWGSDIAVSDGAESNMGTVSGSASSQNVPLLVGGRFGIDVY